MVNTHLSQNLVLKLFIQWLHYFSWHKISLLYDVPGKNCSLTCHCQCCVPFPVLFSSDLGVSSLQQWQYQWVHGHEAWSFLCCTNQDRQKEIGKNRWEQPGMQELQSNYVPYFSSCLRERGWGSCGVWRNVGQGFCLFPTNWNGFVIPGKNLLWPSKGSVAVRAHKQMFLTNACFYI